MRGSASPPHEWGDGTVDPRGHELLSTFTLDRGVPRWRWQVGGTIVERELAMAHGRAAVGVVHRLVRADGPVRLELTPLCTWRSVHGERPADGPPSIEPTVDGFVFEGAYRVAGPGWTPGGDWYRGVRWREEAARGLTDREDLWAAGHVRRDRSSPGRRWRSRRPPRPSTARCRPRATWSRTRRHARRTSGHAPRPPTPSIGSWSSRPTSSSIDGGGGPTAVAGYPWFGEWSRDLMTSYEGLFLATNRWDEGRACLRRAAATVSEGMLANTADTGTLEYNTADGTLWFVHALGRHLAVTGDEDLGAELAPVVRAIIEHHIAGTRFGIGVDPRDGLLRQGAEGWALTWMDARIDGRPVTPRAGKAVEVNALWIEALAVAQRAARRDAVRRRLRGRWARRRPRSFLRRFVRGDGAGLLDVVDGPAGDDASVRPNQLLAVSLPHGPLAGPDATAARARRGRHVRARRCSRRSACGRWPRTTRRYRGLAPRRPRRAGRRLPPGHGLAVAARAVRGRGDRGSARPPTACSTGSRRTSPSGGSGPSPRRRTATRRTAPPAVRSRPGRWRRSCGSGRSSMAPPRSSPRSEHRAMKVMIIGGVAGGASCAARLRRLDEQRRDRDARARPLRLVRQLRPAVPRRRRHRAGVAACSWPTSASSASSSPSTAGPAARSPRSRPRTTR